MARVPEIFHLLYGKVFYLTSQLEAFSLTTSQREKLSQQQALLDRFIVVPRPTAISQPTVSPSASYDRFCRDVQNILEKRKEDAFAVHWYRHGSFGRLLFLRDTFCKLFDLLGPLNSLSLLSNYTIFEEVEPSVYIQWTGIPATSVPVVKPQPSKGTSSNKAKQGSYIPGGVSLSHLGAFRQTLGRRIPRVRKRKYGGLSPHEQVKVASMLYVEDPKKLESRFFLGKSGNLANARHLALKMSTSLLWCAEVADQPFLVHGLRQLLKNHRLCRYHKVLQKHCSHTCENHELFLKPLSDLTEMHESPEVVAAFLQAVLRKLLPVELFGTKANLRRLIKNLSALATVVKGEVLKASCFTWGLKVSKVPWLAKTKNVKMRPIFLLVFVSWCARLAVAIISHHFYVTDMRRSKRRLLFYRRPIWNALSKVWADGANILSDEAYNGSKMQGSGRLLPKGTGDLRLLVTVSHKKDMQNKFRTLKVFLDSLKDDSARDLHLKWKMYALNWKSRGRPPLFFVKADIENCFHSIDHKTALDLLNHAFEKSEAEARLVCFTTIKLGSGATMVRQWLQLFAGDIVRKSFLQGAPMHHYHNGRAKLLVPKICILPNLKALKLLLEDYLLHFHVCLGRTTFRIVRGVVQGGALSSHIADIYLESVLKKHLVPFGKSSDEILLRSMDDFLFITPSKEEATAFLKKFVSGFPDFGMVGNLSKIETNLGYGCYSEALPQHHVHFCGFVFNIATLEVAQEPTDMTSYSASQVAGSCEVVLKKYLQHWQLPLSPLVLDCDINSKGHVLASLLDQLSALAKNFYSTVEGMRYVNVQYVARVILALVDQFLLRSFRSASSAGFALDFSEEEFRYVSLAVFLHGARRKLRCVRGKIMNSFRNAQRKVPSQTLGPLTDFLSAFFEFS